MSKTNKYKEIYKQIESVVNGETIIVPDVHQFPGHIACSRPFQDAMPSITRQWI